MEIQNINWNYPTNMWFGLNRIKEIQKACDNLNINIHGSIGNGGRQWNDIILEIYDENNLQILLNDTYINSFKEELQVSININELQFAHETEYKVVVSLTNFLGIK